MDQQIVKICPSVTDMLTTTNGFPCPEINCQMKFITSPNLDLHLFKCHKIGDPEHWKKKTMVIENHYHCPETSCLYSINSSRYFQKMKYLKQHYLKVHAEKKFKCGTCDKSFPTPLILKNHTPMCGVKYICYCTNAYDSAAALATHFRRTGHSANKKYTTSEKCLKTILLASTSPAIAGPVYMAAIALSELSAGPVSSSIDIGIQTDPTVLDMQQRSKTARDCSRGAKQGISTQTQAGTGVPKSKRQRISTETQTSVEYLLKEAKKLSEVCQKQTATRKRRKSMETQTVTSEKKVHKVNLRPKKSPVKSDGLLPLQPQNELKNALGSCRLGEIWANERNSSSTQTSPVKNFDLEMLNGITQTEPNFAELFETETSRLRTNDSIQPGAVKLASYFEDNTSNGSFGNGVLQTNSYNIANTSGFPSNYDPGYSSSQIDSILTRNNKYVFSESRSCSIETQTEIDSFLRPTECPEDDASYALSSTIQTQTTEDIAAFDQLIYANMCTQTCDEFLFPELDFADIQTQTAWSEYGDDASLVSTETQTALSGRTNAQCWTLSETSHMETQTDEFREMIAEFEKQNKSEELL